MDEFAKRGPCKGGGGCGHGDILWRGLDGHLAWYCKAGDRKNKCYRYGDKGHMKRNYQNSLKSLNAQMVGDAFVEQYYHILHQSPELVYCFYQDLTVLSRPGQDGVMSTVSTMDVLCIGISHQHSHKDKHTVIFYVPTGAMLLCSN